MPIIRFVDQSCPPHVDNQDSRIVSQGHLNPTLPSGNVAHFNLPKKTVAHFSLGQLIVTQDSNPLPSGCLPPTTAAVSLQREVRESSDGRSLCANSNVGVDSQKDSSLPMPSTSHDPPLSHQDQVMAVSFVLMQFLMALGSGYDAAASTFAVGLFSVVPISVTFAKLEASTAIEKVPVDSISISPKAKLEILVNSAPASGMSRGLEDHSLVSDLNLSPQEGACAASGNISTSGLGPIPLPSQADADPPSDLGAVGSVADSLGMQYKPMTLFKSWEGVLEAAGHYHLPADELAAAWRILCKLVQTPTGWTVAGSCDGDGWWLFTLLLVWKLLALWSLFLFLFAGAGILLPLNGGLAAVVLNGKLEVLDSIGSTAAAGGIENLPAVAICICRLPRTPDDTWM
ncbi:hypothetical protein Nepgr_009385 [Nepenthes gracilis]|uniref:Uncharacterized protein n=1 Tax=Nepenthes gracilis TaxID=150966 RepID=A0AAD3XKA7_NEPGR|nr:hypothetical protein Nepgr_009385 [Nepenthes gracilis]